MVLDGDVGISRGSLDEVSVVENLVPPSCSVTFLVIYLVILLRFLFFSLSTLCL